MSTSAQASAAGPIARKDWLAAVILLGAWLQPTSEAQSLQAGPVPPVGGAHPAPALLNLADTVQPPGFPVLGKWMIDPDGTPAHWLGEVVDGKGLREPINIIIVDAGARSPEDAKARLMKAAEAAGYPSRTGHSGGYQGYIGGVLHPQLPSEKDHALSSGPYEFNNNHGRIFGPFLFEGTYLFTGALSREKVDVLTSPMHQYASFNVARDDFAKSMDQATPYKLSGFVNMQNAIVGDPHTTTGDHDGVAAFMKAER
jgi:hypothetical protein